ncbi:MAG: UDP-N-acetylmuramoyl-tripeptide--D-alanyl-D-alanine ligase [Endomicrobiales bacterium]|nr:UDP-N-acetylmuramoyl-tripeptide--D-alanyl-D-alanine ligase [Endomicrobiales bacterium]
MENIYLYQLVDAVKGEFLLGDPHSTVTSVSTDTRTLRKGDYFFALTGDNFDGHNFLQTAVEKGAKGVIVSRGDIDLGKPFPYLPAIIKVKDTLTALGDLANFYRKRFDIPVVAITGSNGKTTVKEMVSAILSLKASTLCNYENYNNQIGLPMTLFNLNSSHKYAVLEMGTSSPGEIKRLSEIAEPAIGAITNIGFTHLEKLADPDGVYNEKKSLLHSLPEKGWAIINKDDKYLDGAVNEVKTNVITYGLNRSARVYAYDIKLWPGYPSFKINIDGTSTPIKLVVYGSFNIYNALAAASIAWALGIDLELIKKGLENFAGPKMRMSVRNLISGTTVINDAYNANPSSMRESILSLVKTFPDRDKVLVLGDMLELGKKTEEEHLKLGEFLNTQPVIQIYLYGVLMEKTFLSLKGAPVKYFKQKKDLIEELRNLSLQNSVVFFKASRGVKLEQVIEKVFPEDEL